MQCFKRRRIYKPRETALLLVLTTLVGPPNHTRLCGDATIQTVRAFYLVSRRYRKILNQRLLATTSVSLESLSVWSMRFVRRLLTPAWRTVRALRIDRRCWLSDVCDVVRCCPDVTSLDLALETRDRHRTLGAISRSCQRLERLTIKCSVHAVAMLLYGPELESLEHLDICCTTIIIRRRDIYEMFRSILIKCPRLTTLKINIADGTVDARDAILNWTKKRDETMDLCSDAGKRLRRLVLSSAALGDVFTCWYLPWLRARLEEFTITNGNVQLIPCVTVLWSDLRKVSIHCHYLTDANVEVLTRCSDHVVEADFRSCPMLTDKSVRWITQRWSGLTSLNLSGNRNVTFETADALPKLETLRMSRTLVAYPGLNQLLARDTGPLKHVALQSCPQLTGRAIKRILRCSPDIRSLDLSRCYLVDDEYLKERPVKCLRILDTTLGSSGVLPLTRCTGLQRLTLHVPGLTRDDLDLLAANICSTITVFRIKHCPRLTDRHVDTLLSRMPGLQVIVFEVCRGIMCQRLMPIVRLRMVEYVSFNQCPQLACQESALVQVLKLPRLKMLEITNCPRTGESIVVQACIEARFDADAVSVYCGRHKRVTPAVLNVPQRCWSCFKS